MNILNYKLCGSILSVQTDVVELKACWHTAFEPFTPQVKKPIMCHEFEHKTELRPSCID